MSEPIWFDGTMEELTMSPGPKIDWSPRHRLHGLEDPIGGHQLKGCDTPSCDRAIPMGVAHCCGGCRHASDMNCEPGDVGIDPPMFSHDEGCETRWAQRKKRYGHKLARPSVW